MVRPELAARRQIKSSLKRPIYIALFTEEYIGKTRVYSSSTKSDYYHADKNCPHLTNAPLYVYPIDHMRDVHTVEPCSYCTVEES